MNHDSQPSKVFILTLAGGEIFFSAETRTISSDLPSASASITEETKLGTGCDSQES